MKLSNQKKIKFDHQKKILDLFLDGNAYSCTDIAKKIHLSNTAVGKILEIFSEKNVIALKEKTLQNDTGRPSVMYELNPDYGLIAAIDLTDNDILVCTANMRMRILSKSVIETSTFITDEVLTRIIDCLTEFLQASNYTHYQAICIGTPDKIDKNTGYFLFAPKFKNCEKVNLHALFSERFQCTVIIKNDVKLALFGEGVYGNCRNVNDVVYLHVDNHFGGAIKLNGKILEGSNGFAGEFGSVRMHNRAEDFKCLSYNVSLGGMLYNYNLQCGFAEYAYPPFTAPEFIQHCLNRDDELALKVLDMSAEHMAVEICNICAVLDCHDVVLNGMVRFFQGDYLDLVQKYIAKYTMDPQKINVSYTALDGKATLLGGLTTAINTYTLQLLNIQ